MSRQDDTRSGVRNGPTDQAFDALADPTRREILEILSQEEVCSAGAIAERITSVGRTAVSTHLRVLRNAGLVRSRREGKFLFYELDATGAARDVVELVHTLFQEALRDAAAAASRADDQQDGDVSGRAASI